MEAGFVQTEDVNIADFSNHALGSDAKQSSSQGVELILPRELTGL